MISLLKMKKFEIIHFYYCTVYIYRITYTNEKSFITEDISTHCTALHSLSNNNNKTTRPHHIKPHHLRIIHTYIKRPKHTHTQATNTQTHAIYNTHPRWNKERNENENEQKTNEQIKS